MQCLQHVSSTIKISVILIILNMLRFILKIHIFIFVLVVSLPELSAGRELNVSFVFSLCCQWERLQTVPLYAYKGLRARVSAVSICSASQIPLCVSKHREDVATVWRRPAFIRPGHCVNFSLTGGFSQYDKAYYSD